MMYFYALALSVSHYKVALKLPPKCAMIFHPWQFSARDLTCRSNSINTRRETGLLRLLAVWPRGGFDTVRRSRLRLLRSTHGTAAGQASVLSVQKKKLKQDFLRWPSTRERRRIWPLWSADLRERLQCHEMKCPIFPPRFPPLAIKPAV